MVWQQIRSLLSSSPRLGREAQPLPTNDATVASFQTIAYWRYRALLNFQTPLTYLKLDGEVRIQHSPELQPIQRGAKGCGDWIPYRSDGFVALTELSPDQIDSWTAESCVQRECKLKFLIRFREIFESKFLHVDQKLMQIYALVDHDSFRAVAPSLMGEQFPDDVFIAELTKLRGIGLKKASLLWNAGLRTPAMVQAASDVELRGIRGIGPKLITQIRAQAVA